MDKINLSKDVCERLAQQLLEEQAELVKREAVVNGLRDVIFRKKTEIINHKIDGQFFKFDHLMYPLIISFSYGSDYMGVSIRFGPDPDDAIPAEVKLTKREMELFEDYKNAFSSYLEWASPEYGKDAWIRLIKLSQLKNRLNLVMYKNWIINLSDATDPDFFKRTGLSLGWYQGLSLKPTMLEDCIRKFKH